MSIYYSDAIKSQISMIDICEKYGYTRNKSDFIPCPFHEDKTPSLKIYDNKKGFYCFSCNFGGSPIDFIMKLFDLDFRSAVYRITYDFNLSNDDINLNRIEKYKKQIDPEIEKFREEYNQKSKLLRELNIIRRNPKHQRFQEALANVDRLEFWFEQNFWR